ncbi:MAG: DUF2799 domain-containing protein [Gammaproteobacteria bacterium]|jgi:hypothetical protein
MPTLTAVILGRHSVFRPVLALAATLGLAACASISEDECRVMDWRTVGYEDGAAGYGPERLTWRREACAPYGVAPDLDAYRSGRDEGLAEFCVPRNGFRLGAAGGAYSGACRGAIADEFLTAYETGRQLWRLERRVDETISGIAARRDEVVRIDQLLSEQGLFIVGERTTTDERAAALLRMKELADRRSEALVELDALERVLPEHEAELEAYRATLRYPGS